MARAAYQGKVGWVEYRFAATKLIQQVKINQYQQPYVTKSFVLKVLVPGSRNTWKTKACGYWHCEDCLRCARKWCRCRWPAP